MELKKGARFHELDSAIVLAAIIADQVWRKFGADGVTLTSGSEGERGDGVHLNRSLHYPKNSPSGFSRAIDLRIWNLPDGAHDAPRAAKHLRERLGDDYDVVLAEDHIHVEFDPK